MRTNSNPNVALIASLVSEPSRAAMLTALLDGRFHPASELANMAGIKPQTASFHLAKMVEGNVIVFEKHGRHRYYGIRDSTVAQTMESLLALAPPVEIKSLRQATEDQAIRWARTCYDHLAGNVGVQLTDSMKQRGIIQETTEGFAVTESGEAFFESLQINIAQVKKKRRSFSHKCLDWSERRHHLGGALGNALLDRLVELQWVQRVPKTRAVSITSEGKQGLKETFSVDI